MRRIRRWKQARPSLHPSLAGFRPLLAGCLILAAGFIYHTGDGEAVWNHCANFAFAANSIASGDGRRAGARLRRRVKPNATRNSVEA